jgi:tether containing UBX domain for GLUT4
LLVKWDSADEAMNASGYPAPLKEELRTKSVPLPPAQPKESPAPGGGATGGGAGAGGAAKEKKIPK